jgi:TPR repeat protein
VEAARLYRQAAEQGFTPAQMALAGMYLRGEGVARSRDEADRWIQRAADAGDPQAKETLESTPLSR